MSFASDFCTGVGQLLATASVGAWGSSFADSDTAIVFGAIPQFPVSAVGLTPYRIADEGNTGYYLQGVQCYFRAPTLAANEDLRDAVRTCLNNRHDFTIAGTVVSRCWWQNGSPLGIDASSNYQASDSYYFATGRQVLY